MINKPELDILKVMEYKVTLDYTMLRNKESTLYYDMFLSCLDGWLMEFYPNKGLLTKEEEHEQRVQFPINIYNE